MATITKAFIKMIMGHDPKFSAITGKVARMYSQKYTSFATRQLATSVIVDEELVKFIAAVWNWCVLIYRSKFVSCSTAWTCSLLKSLCRLQILSTKLYTLTQMVKACLKANRFSGSDLSTGLPFNLNGPQNNPSIICLLVNDGLSLRFSSLGFSVFS